MSDCRNVLLVQLPIPPPGPVAVEGNVPLAAAYLKLHARRQGLERSYNIELLPPSLANTLGDRALVEAILARRPWMVGFTCYVWNVQRTLWIARQLKLRQPELKVLLGGPEITADNAWVLEDPAIDHAVLGEGEPAFAELLAALADGRTKPRVLTADNHGADRFALDSISSPYREGILDLSDGGRLMLETVRGCRFRCKYCYYPKSFDTLRFLSDEQIVANLRYAIEHDAAEVVLLDPTLNQRPDLPGFLRLLAENNPGRKMAFSAELRAEGIDGPTARLLREANFKEVEIGLQSVEPQAWKLMGRPTNLAAFERGAKALLDEGIKVQVDLILGLPGDTVDSVRRGIDFLHRTQAYSEAQVFNLSILPGTAFRREAAQLGLSYQPWPPYYVLKTPTLDLEQMYGLMEEAQDAFGIEFDPLPPPRLDGFDGETSPRRGCRVDIDTIDSQEESCLSKAIPGNTALCFTLWLRSTDFHRRRDVAATIIERLLADNPHTTLHVILEPTAAPERLTAETLEWLLAACYRTPTYLDRYYSLHPGRLLGSKRLFVLLPPGANESTSPDWLDQISDYATTL
jgi:hypothetical protein